MPVIKHEQTTKKIAQLIEQGYGQGEKENYKPFIDTLRVSSRGRVSRIKSWTTNRVHHFFSDLETRFFYLLEYFGCLDIREHYPLIDGMEMIMENLDDGLIKRLINQKTGEPLILTTSFFVTVKDINGDISSYARSIKDYRQLENSQVIERYEIMRRYWEARGVDYAIITNKEIPKTIAKNIEYIHSAYHLQEYDIGEEQQGFYGDLLIRLIISFPNHTVKEVIHQFDKELNTAGTGLLVFKHLLARKRLKVDLIKPINLDQPCSSIEMAVVKGGKDFDSFGQYANSIG